MTAIYTVTLVCDGGSPFSSGCPSGSTLVLEQNSSGLARKEAARVHGWSVCRWPSGATKNARKLTDVCNVCDPTRKKTR